MHKCINYVGDNDIKLKIPQPNKGRQCSQRVRAVDCTRIITIFYYART